MRLILCLFAFIISVNFVQAQRLVDTKEVIRFQGDTEIILDKRIYEYTYTKAGLLEESVISTWEGSWEKSLRTTYRYDELDRLVNQTNYKFDVTNRSWKLNFEREYNYANIDLGIANEVEQTVFRSGTKNEDVYTFKYVDYTKKWHPNYRASKHYFERICDDNCKYDDNGTIVALTHDPCAGETKDIILTYDGGQLSGVDYSEINPVTEVLRKTKSISYTYTNRRMSNPINYSDVPVSIYPNPANSHFFIEGLDDDIQLISVDLYNNSGKVAHSFVKDVPNQKYDIENLSPGPYYVKITTTEGIRTEKLMIVQPF